MRYAIFVVGSAMMQDSAPPEIALRGDEAVQMSTWYMRPNQADSGTLLGDYGSAIGRLFVAPLLAYRFYLHVNSMKLWSGKRPLVLVSDRSLASRIAAYAGSWGGGDVVNVGESQRPLGPTRYELNGDGSLRMLSE